MPEYNTKFFVYLNGHNRVIYSNKNIFHTSAEYSDFPGECCDGSYETPFSVSTRKRCKADEADTRVDSVMRSKQRVFDIAYCNDWKWFFTGTFDPSKIDYDDPKVVRKAFSNWARNLVRNRGF